MARNPYFYFSSMYDNTTDAVLCVDCNLQVVYISHTFRNLYNFDISDDVLTNCFIPNKFSCCIRNAISDQKYTSFDYLSLTDNSPKKCIVFPTTINEEKYASLLITSVGGFDDQAEKLRNSIFDMEANVKDHTFDIISHIRPAIKDFKNLYNDPVFINTLKIRKEAENLYILATKDLKLSEYLPIDLNKYLKRTTEIISELLGDKRVVFEYDFSSDLIFTQMRYETFDILISSIITLAIKNTKGRASITVRTKRYLEQSMVVIGDSLESCDEAEKLLCTSEEKLQVTPVIEKLLKEIGSIYVCIPNKSKGKTIGFTLPPLLQRADILKDQRYDKVRTEGFLSIIGSALADLLDD